MKTTDGKQYKLYSFGHEIVVRPKELHDSAYPTHTPHRILFGFTIVTVAGCNKYTLAQALTYEPEARQKKCPRCKQKDWSLWLPLAIESRDFFDGEWDKSFVKRTEWVIICRHCGSIVDRVGGYEIYPGQPTEYVYDPSQNEPFSAFGRRVEPRKKKR